MPVNNNQIKEQIKQRIQLSELAGSYGVERMKLTSRNGQYIACCPFHDDNNPSFSISDSKKLFNCFSCDASGDIFSFIMKIEGIGFKAALNKLSAITRLNNSTGKNNG